MKATLEDLYLNVKDANAASDYAYQVLARWDDRSFGIDSLMSFTLDFVVSQILGLKNPQGVSEHFQSYRNEKGFLVDQIYEEMLRTTDFAVFKGKVKKLDAELKRQQSDKAAKANNDEIQKANKKRKKALTNAIK
jgi:hypothetical protein